MAWTPRNPPTSLETIVPVGSGKAFFSGRKRSRLGLLSYQYGIPAPSKGERATFPFDLTQVRSSGGVRNPRGFLVGRPSQAHTMGMIPCWITSFPPTEKKKKEKVKIVQNSFGVSVGCLFQLSICWVQIEEGAAETRSAYWKPCSKTGPFSISSNIIKVSSNA